MYIRSAPVKMSLTIYRRRREMKFYTMEEGWWSINFPSISPLNVLSNNHMCEHILLFLSFDPIITHDLYLLVLQCILLNADFRINLTAAMHS
jgi:hypothetical protein